MQNTDTARNKSRKQKRRKRSDDLIERGGASPAPIFAQSTSARFTIFGTIGRKRARYETREASGISGGRVERKRLISTREYNLNAARNDDTKLYTRDTTDSETLPPPSRPFLATILSTHPAPFSTSSSVNHFPNPAPVAPLYRHNATHAYEM